MSAAAPPAARTRWAILASHATKDDLRFLCRPGTYTVTTFPTEEAARQEIRWIDGRRKAGLAGPLAGFNLYTQALTGGEA